MKIRTLLLKWPRILRVLWLAIFCVDTIIALIGRSFSQNRRDIIFVRADSLGDFILWLPAIRALRKQWLWPGRRLLLIANDQWAKFAEDQNIFDEVVPISVDQFRYNLWYRFYKVFKLSAIEAELVVTPIRSREPTIIDSIAKAITSRRKIATASDSGRATIFDKAFGDRWYDELFSQNGPHGHESSFNQKFIEVVFNIRPPNPWPTLIGDLRARLPTSIKEVSYAVIAPGARIRLKAWPVSRFTEISYRIATRTTLRVVLVGEMAELAEAQELRNMFPKPIDLIGHLDINALIAVLKHARIVITNDTASAHMGAALRVPTICVVGGGHPRRFVPYPQEAAAAGIQLTGVYKQMPCYGCNWRCIFPLSAAECAPCISEVSVDMVWNAVEEEIKGCAQNH
jgi:ADP-heptose:LPS heptosyltransferase